MVGAHPGPLPPVEGHCAAHWSQPLRWGSDSCWLLEVSGLRAVSVLACRRLQQHAELVHDALSLGASLRWHHPNHCYHRGDVLACPREVGRTVLITQDLVVDRLAQPHALVTRGATVRHALAAHAYLTRSRSSSTARARAHSAFSCS
jgi:hypothetical protein